MTINSTTSYQKKESFFISLSRIDQESFASREIIYIPSAEALQTLNTKLFIESLVKKNTSRIQIDLFSFDPSAVSKVFSQTLNSPTQRIKPAKQVHWNNISSVLLIAEGKEYNIWISDEKTTLKKLLWWDLDHHKKAITKESLFDIIAIRNGLKLGISMQKIRLSDENRILPKKAILDYLVKDAKVAAYRSQILEILKSKTEDC